MEWLKKFDLTGKQFFKLIALLVVALVALTILANLLSSSTGLLVGDSGSFSMPQGSFNSVSYDKGVSVSESSARYIEPPIGGGYTPGSDAEDFEVKDYGVTIESRNLAEDCAVVSSLKTRPEVIFENTNEYLRGCNYTFKVKNEAVAGVLAVLEELDPKELRESSYTIKQEVTYYADEVTILENKLASLDKTLTEAIASYDSLTSLATNVRDVESLARIIDSKLLMIERLTNAKLETSNRLDQMMKAKSEALDKMDYTYFNVSIYENKFVDGQEIKDSWKMAVKSFVRDVNSLLQDISINFVAFLLLLVKFALYLVTILLLARFGWIFAKKVWHSGNQS